jgi:hypothetical protein
MRLSILYKFYSPWNSIRQDIFSNKISNVQKILLESFITCSEILSSVEKFYRLLKNLFTDLIRIPIKSLIIDFCWGFSIIVSLFYLYIVELLFGFIIDIDFCFLQKLDFIGKLDFIEKLDFKFYWINQLERFHCCLDWDDFIVCMLLCWKFCI